MSTRGSRVEDLIARLRPMPSRRPELDGLRGIAILLVLWAHLLGGFGPNRRAFLDGIPQLLPGGGLTGVQLFFVLSGFLITSILLRDFDGRGIHALPRFYGRRARRLLPALVLLCAAYALVVLFAREGAAQRLGWGSIWAALTYTHNLPIFDNDGWLGHTWSLAVEEQFYLVWPILLLGALRFGRVPLAIGVALIIIVVTSVLRHVLPISDATGWTLFRWDALMIGAVIAMVPIRVGLLGGIAGLLVLGYFSVTTVTFHPDVYTATGLASAVIILAAAEHRWLRHPVLQFFGLISYGLYLWHMLILRFGLFGPLSLTLAIGIAAASYIVIELPILRWRTSRLGRDPVSRHVADAG